ncbi:MAG: type II toxin-antitoxin system RelE/ParE family toxin [Vicinamibacterales bacterium]
MTRRRRIHSDAAAELSDAVRWYESKRLGLGRDLLDDVSTAIDRVADNPEAATSLSTDGKTRRVLVSRFPYQLVVRLRETELVIVAIAHLKRRPGYWRHRH